MKGTQMNQVKIHNEEAYFVDNLCCQNTVSGEARCIKVKGGSDLFTKCTHLANKSKNSTQDHDQKQA